MPVTELTQELIHEVRAEVGEDGNAYDRTKRACAALAARGIEPPAWISMREILGRGSSSDIQRGLNDHRKEAMEKITAHRNIGLPPRAADAALVFMQIAREEAEQELAKEKAQAQAAVDHLQAQLEEAQTQLADTTQALKDAEAMVHAQDVRINELERLVEAERGAKEASERHVAELRGDAERGRLAFERLQTESQKQIAIIQDEMKRQVDLAEDRYRALEKKSLLEIDAARTERDKAIAMARDKAASDVALAESRAKRDVADARNELARERAGRERAQAAAKEERDRADKAQERIDALSREVGQLDGQISVLQGQAQQWAQVQALLTLADTAAQAQVRQLCRPADEAGWLVMDHQAQDAIGYLVGRGLAEKRADIPWIRIVGGAFRA